MQNKMNSNRLDAKRRSRSEEGGRRATSWGERLRNLVPSSDKSFGVRGPENRRRGDELARRYKPQPRARRAGFGSIQAIGTKLQ